MSVPLWYKRVILPGMTGLDVDVVRRKLGFSEGGPYDSAVQSKVRGMANKNKVTTDGEVSPAVAKMLGESEANRADVAPEWFKRELGPKDMFSASGEDVRQLRGRLALDVGDDRYTPEVEDAVRRFQSYSGLEPTGVVDERVAKLLG